MADFAWLVSGTHTCVDRLGVRDLDQLVFDCFCRGAPSHSAISECLALSQPSSSVFGPEGLDLVLAEALRRLLTGGYEPAYNWRDAATS